MSVETLTRPIVIPETLQPEQLNGVEIESGKLTVVENAGTLEKWEENLKDIDPVLRTLAEAGILTIEAALQKKHISPEEIIKMGFFNGNLTVNPEILNKYPQLIPVEPEFDVEKKIDGFQTGLALLQAAKAGSKLMKKPSPDDINNLFAPDAHAVPIHMEDSIEVGRKLQSLGRPFCASIETKTKPETGTTRMEISLATPLRGIFGEVTFSKYHGKIEVGVQCGSKDAKKKTFLAGNQYKQLGNIARAVGAMQR